jgi:hypothetical protein
MTFQPEIYFKFFPENLVLRGFQYKLGLNTDIHPFDESYDCVKGGLYYTDIDHLEEFKRYGEMIGVIRIPTDVEIVRMNDKYKSPSIFIENIYSYEEFLRDKSLYSEVKLQIKNPIMKLKLVEQTPELCLEAVKQDGMALQSVKKQTPKLCLEAIKKNGRALRFVKEQTPELCLAAIKKNGRALRFVKEQTPELCFEAVKQNGMALEFVKEQTPELCLEAINQAGWALYFVKEKTPELCLEAVKQDGIALQFVKEQTPELCLEAVKQNRKAYMYVTNTRTLSLSSKAK